LTFSKNSVIDKRYTVADFRARAAERAGPIQRGDFGDHHLNPDAKELFLSAKWRDAAVLIPVVDRPDMPTVLLTQRTMKLRTHSGQIAFPGGRIDPEDHDAETAAMRECEEETGIGPEHVEIVGRLPEYMAGSGFRIAPILSVLEPGFTLKPNPHEVDAVFEVPLAFLMDEANHAQGSRIVGGHMRHYFEMPYEDWHIWGVTAGIIRVMYERLYT
jgi:8-oxo-dGTP pyrophosphatase MutT (NUDIX family)